MIYIHLLFFIHVVKYVCDSYLSLKESFDRGAVTGIDNSDRQVVDKAESWKLKVVCRVAIFLSVVDFPFGPRLSFIFLSLFIKTGLFL